MITVFNAIQEIDRQLTTALTQQWLINYHLLLGLNNEIFAYLLVKNGKLSTQFTENLIEKYPFVEWKEVVEQDLEDDFFYQDLFKIPNGSIDIKGSRRRFSHLLDPDDADKDMQKAASVITFYSYKGGVGRSTAMASFAMALANGAVVDGDNEIKPQKVIIIDFDLEAPGFMNFFLPDTGKPHYQNGVVEYLMDTEFDKKVDLKNYIWKVESQYVEDGEIWVMPAGNLNPTVANATDFLKTPLNHYLEGLARLDIASPKYLVEMIRDKLLQQIRDVLQPDFILIDSRTGFNDIFGLTALQLSEIMIGFFGSNAQTQAGLHFFLDACSKHERTKSLIVNAILPEQTRIIAHESFKKLFSETLAQIAATSNYPAPPVLKIMRNVILESVGATHEDMRLYKELILEREFKDYNLLFDAIFKLAKTPKLRTAEAEFQKNKQLDENKRLIFKQLRGNLFQPYEKSNHQNQPFFFRKVMESFLEPYSTNRITISGQSHAGKTYFCNALRNQETVKQLQAKTNNEKFIYHFVYPNLDITLLERMEKVASNKENTPSDSFLRNCWFIYIWDALMNFAKKQAIYMTQIPNLPTFNGTLEQQIVLMRHWAADYTQLSLIEKDLQAMEHQISGKIRFFVLVDCSDTYFSVNMLKTLDDAARNFFRNSYIKPKFFLNDWDFSHFYNDVVPVPGISSTFMSFNWQQTEIFAYLFTVICSNNEGKTALFKLIEQNHPDVFKEWRKLVNREWKLWKQFPIKEPLVRTTADALFGAGQFDKIFRTLQNAGGSISLAVFVDWVHRVAKAENTLDILNHLILKFVVERYLTDLETVTQCDYLKYLQPFYQHNDSIEYRQIEFDAEEFNDWLETFRKHIEQHYQKFPDKETLKNMLCFNRIVYEKDGKYTFAILFHAYLK